MKIGLQDTNWSYIGARLAQTDDNEQAAFFKAFVKECLAWGTRYQVEIQLAGVNHKLSSQEKSVLGMIGYEGEG